MCFIDENLDKYYIEDQSDLLFAIHLATKAIPPNLKIIIEVDSDEKRDFTDSSNKRDDSSDEEDAPAYNLQFGHLFPSHIVRNGYEYLSKKLANYYPTKNLYINTTYRCCFKKCEAMWNVRYLAFNGEEGECIRAHSITHLGK